VLSRVPSALVVVAALAPLCACATGGGAGEGSGEGGGSVSGRRRVHVLDLMAKKPDSAPIESGNTPGPVRGRKLDRAVSRTVENHRQAFQSCVERSSKQKGRVHARATLLLTVRSDGVVSDARVQEKKVRAKPLGQCLVDASYRMTFPPFDGPPMQVRVPLSLTAE